MGAINFLNEAGKQYGTLLGKLVPVKPAYRDLKKLSNKMTDKANANRRQNNALTLGYNGEEIDGTNTPIKKTIIPQEMRDAIAEENKQALKDPTRAPLSPDFKMNDEQYRQSSTGVDGFSAMTPMTASGGGGHLGRDHSRSMIYTNLGRTPLEQELSNRDNIGYVKSGGNSRFVGGQPIDKDKIKMLENIGMVKVKSQDDIKQSQHEAWMANYQTLINEGHSPQQAKAMADNHREGRDLGAGVNLGPKLTRVSAPSRGGFFENLGRYSNAVRQNKERIAAEKFDRKQSHEEAIGKSEMAYRQKRTDLYDAIQLAGINKKNAEANRTDVLASLDPTKVNAEAAKNTARGNYYNAYAGKLDAEAAEVAANAAIDRDLKAAKTGNYEALMRLNDEKAEAIPAKLQAEVQNILAQAGLRQAQTGLTSAKANEVAANAQVDRAVKTSRANAYVKQIAGQYNLNEAKVREITNTEPFKILQMQKNALQAEASAGNYQASADLKQVEIAMSQMFMQQ